MALPSKSSSSPKSGKPTKSKIASESIVEIIDTEDDNGDCLDAAGVVNVDREKEEARSSGPSYQRGRVGRSYP